MNTNILPLSTNAKRLFFVVLRIANERKSNKVSVRDAEACGRSKFTMADLKDATSELLKANLLTCVQGDYRTSYALVREQEQHAAS